MSKHVLAALTAVAVGGLALAQEPATEKKTVEVIEKKVEVAPPSDKKTEERPAQKEIKVVEIRKEQSSPGRFTVAAAGDTAVLLDTVTGQTWVLRRTGAGGVWVPARRLDSDKEARDLDERDRAIRQDEQAAERERMRRLMAERQDLLRRIEVEREQARQAEEQARRAAEDALRRLRELEQKQKELK